MICHIRKDFWCIQASFATTSGLCTKMGDYGTGTTSQSGVDTFYKICCAWDLIILHVQECRVFPTLCPFS